MARTNLTVSVSATSNAFLTCHVRLLALCLTSVHMWRHHAFTSHVTRERLLSVTERLIRRVLSLTSNKGSLRRFIALEEHRVAFVLRILHFNSDFLKIGLLSEIQRVNPLFKHLLVNSIQSMNKLRGTYLERLLVISFLQSLSDSFKHFLVEIRLVTQNNREMLN